MTGDEGKGAADSLPEDVRARLRELAARVENERSSLSEAKLMREAEVSSLQTELKKREEAWNEERASLVKSLSLLKAEKEAVIRESATLVAALEAELRKRQETQLEEKNLLMSDLANTRAELESKRKQWADVSAEWQRRVEQMTVAAGEAAERETKLQLMMEAEQTALKKMELNWGLLEDAHRAALRAQEKRHEDQLNAALEELGEMCKGADKKTPPPPKQEGQPPTDPF